MKSVLVLIFSAIVFLFAPPTNDSGQSSLRLHISENGRYLVKADGSPFFWLGDTAWELPHRLNRDEVKQYFQSCVEKGINVVQMVALAELSGLTATNAYGDLPLIDKNPEKPAVTPGSRLNHQLEYDYWDHLDYIIDTAESFGIYVALLPSWGSYLWENASQKADPIFNESNATVYGEWLGERYAKQDNLIWVLGGDRIPDSRDKLTIVRNMAAGLDAGGGTQLKTYHPWGGKSSSEYFHEDDWLDFNSLQSGHASKDFANYEMVKKDYAKKPVKPVIDMEARYEHLPIKFDPDNGYFDGYDARQAAYWSVFAGAFGHTYGHNSIWQMYGPGHPSAIHASVHWSDALEANGRSSLKWLKMLMESRPADSRVPDQSLIKNDYEGELRIAALRGEDYAFIYSSAGKAFTVNMGKISGNKVAAHWYNPRTGASELSGSYRNAGSATFTPPSEGRGHDWVLILDDQSKAYDIMVNNGCLEPKGRLPT